MALVTDVKIKTRTCTPLHNAAAAEGYKKIAKLLISKVAVANPKGQNIGGYTPLHEAVRWGYQEITQLLIVKGVNINPKDDFGQTSLD